MALAIIDGFDYYGTGAHSVLWDITQAVNYTTGRFSGQAANTAASNSTHRRTLPNATTSFVVSCAIRPSNIGTARNIVELLDTGTVQCAVQISTTGYLSFVRGTTVVATAVTGQLSNNTWYWLEFKCTVDDSTGSYEIRLDGTNVLSGSNVDTKQTSNASVNRVGFVTTNAGTAFLIDDFVVQDDQGGTPTFLGECRISMALPNASGNSAQWTRSTGANNWALVDENPPNGDTDYVSSSNVGDKDTYGYPTFGVTGAVIAVQTNLYARKDDAGTRKIKSVVRQSSTDYDASVEHTLASGYDVYQTIYTTDPSTSTAWSASGVDAAEFGVKLTV